MQDLALTACEGLRSPDRLDPVLLVSFGDRRKAHDVPRLLREDVADEIVFVQPLHDDHNSAVAFVVEPAVEGVVVPLVGGLPLRLRERLFRLQGIIDQDDVGTTPGKHATGGGSEPVSLAGGDELLDGLAVCSQSGRKHLLIPRAQHDGATIARQFVGELLAIADTEELDRRIVAETPGWKGDRGHQGFKMPRWQVDDQPPDRALPHRGQLGGDNFEVPVCRKRRLRVEFGKTALSEKIEIRPKDRIVFGRRKPTHRRFTHSRCGDARGCGE
jgi:hypothetical protein